MSSDTSLSMSSDLYALPSGAVTVFSPASSKSVVRRRVMTVSRGISSPVLTSLTASERRRSAAANETMGADILVPESSV